MNISALLVFVSAVVSVYGYRRGLPCSNCNHPCSTDRLINVTKQLLEQMKFSDCRQNKLISEKANPTWNCELTDISRIETVYNATCGKCRDPDYFEEAPILQNINMFFKQSCSSMYNHSLYILAVKPITISLGCTCVQKRFGRYTH